jgi:hypothetical protein
MNMCHHHNLPWSFHNAGVSLNAPGKARQTTCAEIIVQAQQARSFWPKPTEATVLEHRVCKCSSTEANPPVLLLVNNLCS